MKYTKLLTISIVTTVLVYGVYFYAHIFIRQSISRTLSLRAEAASAMTLDSQSQEIADVYQSTIDDRKKIRSLFVSENDTVTFIETLESVGSLAGSVLNISSIESIFETEQDLGLLRAHIEAKGSWQAIMRTLMLIENMPYRSTISHVRIDASGSVDNNREWRIVFDLEVSTVI